MSVRKKLSAIQTSGQAPTKFSRTRFLWISQKELIMLQTMHDRQNEGYRADSGAKPAVIQAVIAAVVAIGGGSSPEPSQIDTKIGTFKKDLRNWLKLTTEMSGFGKDSETGAVIASEDQWNQLLSISFNKDAYGKFRNKPLANEELLSILFLDTMVIGAHVRTPHDIVVDEVVSKNDEFDIEEGIAEDEVAEEEVAEERLEEEEQEEDLHARLALELQEAQNELQKDEETDVALQTSTPTSRAPSASPKSPLSTSSSTFSLKRTTIDQDKIRSKKKTKLSNSELLVQTIGGLNKRIDTLSLQMAEESKSMAAVSISWSERALKIVTERYGDFSPNDIVDLMDIVSHEAEARLFVCVSEHLQRDWVAKHLNQRYGHSM